MPEEPSKPTEHMSIREVHEDFTIVVVRESIMMAQHEALSQFSVVADHIGHNDCILVEAIFESAVVLGLPAYRIHGTVKGTPERMARLLKGGGVH